MDTLAEKLNSGLRTWNSDIAVQVRDRVTELIELADQDVVDLVRSRAIEQKVLDLLDEHPTRSSRLPRRSRRTLQNPLK